MNEEIVLILDVNRSMKDEISAGCENELAEQRISEGGTEIESGEKDLPNNDGEFFEDFLGTTKFDVARCIAQELVLDAAASSRSLNNRTDIHGLITLRETPPNNEDRTFISSKTPEERKGKRNRPWEDMDTGKGLRIERDVAGGCCCYYFQSKDDYHNESDRKRLLDWFSGILDDLHVSPAWSVGSNRHLTGVGDFVTGIVRATEVLRKNTTVGATRRSIVLITDARHKVLEVPDTRTMMNCAEDPINELVVAMNHLKAMNCMLQVVGIGFQREKFEDDHETGDSIQNGIIKKEIQNTGEGVESHVDDNSDGETSVDDDDDEEEDVDWSDVQDQNELLLVDLVGKLGGCVLAVNSGKYNDDVYGVRRALAKLNSSGMSSLPPSEENPGIKKEIDHETKRTSAINDATIIRIECDDRSSLQPNTGTRTLLWNGTDDVLLPEWIEVARPSRWSRRIGGDPSIDEGCSWIQIDDPLLSPPIREPIDSARAGNWLVGCSLEDADAVWEKIAVATAYGKLGPSSKISPSKDLLLQQEEHHRQTLNSSSDQPIPDTCYSANSPSVVVACVRVKDCTDCTEVKRVFDALCTDLEIRPNLLVFHAELFEDPGMYITNIGQLPQCLYTGKDVASWA